MNERQPIRTGTYRSGTHPSYWGLTALPPQLPTVTGDMKVDVVIVGGGIAGLTIAYNLVRIGKSVALVEDGEIGSGETGRTSAHLASALDDRFFHLNELFGEADTRIIAQSHHQAIGDVERIVREEHIDCEFKRVPGYLFLHPSDTEETLVKELRAAVDAGLPVSRVDSVPGIKGFGPALKFEDQARFHPLKYLRGLAEAVVRHGGKVFTKSHADDITEQGVVVHGHRITADHVVVATNSPVVDKYWIHLVQNAYRTYVVGGLIPKGALPDALWWDTGDHTVNKNMPPYHYVRVTSYDAENDLVLCGGQDHPVGLPTDTHVNEEDRYAALEGWAKVHCGVREIVQRWSGQVIQPIDSIAYIGRDPFNKGNVYIVTGDSGSGLTHATIAGTLIANLITKRSNGWERIYSPSRFSMLKAGSTLLSEFFGGLMSYLKSKPTPESDLGNLGRGDGRIVELAGKPYGAYKDDDGACHLVDAKCTHLQCTVKWNADEQSWDCPCHGSRFTFRGNVLNGPANTPLPYHMLRADQVAHAQEEELQRQTR